MADLHAQLAAFVAANLPEAADLAVSEPVALGGGSSKNNWAFEVAWTQDGVAVIADLVLRQEPAAGVVAADLGHEFAFLSILGGSGLPVPPVRWADLAPTFFERPSMVVERSPGRADRAALREKDPLGLGEQGRLALAASLADLLAAVHAADLGVAALREPGDDPARDELDRWSDEVDAEALDPGGRLGPARAWLRAHLPPPVPRLHIVHGDFRPANVLVEDGRISALLDWELAHLGDPADDLGWYTCSIYRTEHFPPGWAVEDFLARYAAGGGQAPDPARLRFWQVLSVFRLAVIALRAARNAERGLAEGPPPPVDRVLDQLASDLD